MPPHLIKRDGRKGASWYLVDGRDRKSLKTSVKGHALQLLEKYARGKLKLTQGITIGEFYEEWIKQKEKDTTLRKSLVTSYRQHFSCYILSEFRHVHIGGLSVSSISRFRSLLLQGGVSLKTARNILDGSFRALWKDARRASLVESNPFELLDWPAYHRPPPDPYTIEERDAILAWVAENEGFYYPWVYFAFATGCRPSEACALRWADLDRQSLTITISKSRHLGAESQPKTMGSYRRIKVDEGLFDVLEAEAVGNQGRDDYIFCNKISRGPLDANQWTRIYWKRICDGAHVRRRKFYCARHTSITEGVKQRNNLLAVAQYHGTSVEMIQRNYCGILELDAPNMPQIEVRSLVIPAGIEPASQSHTNKNSRKIPQLVKKVG